MGYYSIVIVIISVIILLAVMISLTLYISANNYIKKHSSEIYEKSLISISFNVRLYSVTFILPLFISCTSIFFSYNKRD